MGFVSSQRLTMDRARGRSGWMTWSVPERKPISETALTRDSALTTALTTKTSESNAVSIPCLKSQSVSVQIILLISLCGK